MRVISIVVALVLSVGVLSPPAAARSFTVEAEARTRDAGFCASDGERVQTNRWADTSGEAILFLPHHGCWAEWDLDMPIRSITMTVLRPNGTGSGITECHVFDVHIDGHAVGSSPEQCGEPHEPQVWEVLPLVDSLSLPAGPHTLRVTMRITRGPSWGNAYIDYLTVSGSPPGSPSEPLDASAKWELETRGVVVGWQAPASTGDAPLTGYRVYRATGNSVEQLIAELDDVRTFTDASVRPGETYRYTVTAVNDAGEGIQSAPAAVSIPGGTLLRESIAVGPSEAEPVVEIAGRNDGEFYCVTTAVRAADPSRIFCVNLLGMSVPDVGPVPVTVPAGTTTVLDARYYYDPERLVTVATGLEQTIVLKSPVSPADAGWLEENADLVGVEISVGSETVVIPALGQVLGALNGSTVAGRPVL